MKPLVTWIAETFLHGGNGVLPSRDCLQNLYSKVWEVLSPRTRKDEYEVDQGMARILGKKAFQIGSVVLP